MNKINLTPAWQALQKHHEQISSLSIIEQFTADKERFKKFSLEAAGLFLDYSKNRITAETMSLLFNLAETAELKTHIETMFNGAIINTTEHRAVLHTALRSAAKEPILVDNQNVMPQIREVLEQMGECVKALHNGTWKGYSGKNITDVVNIGIGGSDLGPAMVTKALTPYHKGIKLHFVSNVDATHIAETIRNLNPETTLFIIASKTFTTQETMCNAESARTWLLQKAPNTPEVIKQHFIAVTAKPEHALKFGITSQNIFPFWDWVGGRFSLWSAIGLSIAIAIGMDNFCALLAGANSMDQHFRETEFTHNLPVILALIGIWNINFLNMQTLAVIPYDQYLELLPTFLQQLEMESNGKHVRIDGSDLAYTTAPVIWGSVGTNGQHAFHQLLMQGTQTIPVDFIAPAKNHNNIGNHQLLLLANCLAQSQALMQGRSKKEIIEELQKQNLSQTEIDSLTPHKVIPGNIPSNTILTQELTPKTLGALIALYEHKVFVQGIIWQINSFDQWGVELGKKLANAIIPILEHTKSAENLDASTRGLIEKLNKANAC